jgi:hypothetical protein
MPGVQPVDEKRKRTHRFQHGAAEPRIDVAPSARGEKKIPEYKSCWIRLLIFGDLLLAAWAALRPTTSMLCPRRGLTLSTEK